MQKRTWIQQFGTLMRNIWFALHCYGFLWDRRRNHVVGHVAVRGAVRVAHLLGDIGGSNRHCAQLYIFARQGKTLEEALTAYYPGTANGSPGCRSRSSIALVLLSCLDVYSLDVM